MTDKIYCLSSYLAMRYIVDDNKDFFQTLKHQQYHQHPLDHRIFVGSVEDTDVALKNQFKLLRHEKLGIMLSGGMDSAILASYMPKGADAYTFRFLDGKFQSDELERAEHYAQIYQLKLHYVDINWSVVESCVDEYFKNWEGPKRAEFRKDIPMDELTGNQKWQLWCAELFLNMFD